MKVSLNIVDAIKLDKDNFTLHYKSIIIHGKPKEIIDEITKRKSMTLVSIISTAAASRWNGPAKN